MSPTVWRQAYAKLKQPGGGIMLAIDEYVGRRVAAPSFGRTPRTDGNLGKAVRLALRTRAVIVPFHSERLAGASLVTRILPLVEPVGDPRDDAAVLEVVGQLDRMMEGAILPLLDQWYMALKYRPAD
jgi:lauroyl/myristoyl acyltransferase